MKPRQPTGASRQGAKSGQVILQIRDLPSEPPSVQEVCPYPGPERSPAVPENDHGDRDPTRTRPRTTRAARILGLRCRNCGAPQPLGPTYVCPACFGPLEVDYDYAVVGATLTARDDRGARARHLALRSSCCPVDAPPARGLAVGSTPLIAADRLGADARYRPALDQGRHPQPDPVVQGPGGGRRGGPGGRVRRRGARLRVDRQPRRGDRRRRGGRRAAGLRVHPGRPRAGQGRPRAGLRRDGRADRRHLRRRQPAVSRSRRRDRLGLRQHQPPAVLRRGLEDARLRDRRVARLAVARRRRRARSRRGRCSPARPRLRGAGRRSA